MQVQESLAVSLAYTAAAVDRSLFQFFQGLLRLHLVEHSEEPFEGLLISVDPEKVHLFQVVSRTGLGQAVVPFQLAPGTLPLDL